MSGSAARSRPKSIPAHLARKVVRLGAWLIAGILLAALPAAWAEPVMVSDRLYHAGPEGNLGLGISAKFDALAALAGYLSPDGEVGTFAGRTWTLFDILVDADLNANGFAAAWRVSGPAPLVRDYRRRLEQDLAARRLVDFSVQPLDFRPTAFWETEGDPIEITLSADRPRYRPGDPILIRAAIRNNTRNEMLLVRPQGGSDRAWQYPLGFFELKDAQGTRIETYAPRCKTMDPMPTSAFFTLAPGASAELYPEGHPLDRTYVIDRPGTYFVTYRYSTVAAKEWQWYGAYSDAYWEARLENEFWRRQEQTVRLNRLLLDRLERYSTRTQAIRIDVAAGPVTRDEALETARAVCAHEGWPWQDPYISEQDRFWQITTRRTTLGANAFIRIDKETGAVVDKHLTGP